MRLYEISDAIEYILSHEVDVETGEITDETLLKLEDLEMQRDEKALACAAYLKGELAEADAVEREIAALKKRADGHRGRAKRLKSYIESCLPSDAEPISDARSRLAWRNNPPSVAIPDESKVPAEFQRVIPEARAPDKKKIKDALGVPGARLPFAMLVQSKRLEIK